MASTHTTLDAAAADRKSRLAKLAALKRKQPSNHDDELNRPRAEDEDSGGGNNGSATDVTTQYLSGRNFDPATRGPRLGFESAPTEGQMTLEEQASKIAISTAEAAKEDEEGDKTIDLFKLQPKKPNWDLKRDLDEKLKVLNVRTENAIARLVRERIQSAQKAARERPKLDGGGKESDEVGMEGEALLESIHAREREMPDDEEEA